jgi:hypothetical protein
MKKTGRNYDQMGVIERRIGYLEGPAFFRLWGMR